MGSAEALIFGGAWHRAMDAVWTGMAAGHATSVIIDAGVAAFRTEWVAAGLPLDMDLTTLRHYGARTPSRAHEMIVHYVHERRRLFDTKEIELVDIERPFAVPLDPEDESLFYVGKIDKVVRRHKKIGGIEHKTTTSYKKDGGFKNSFLDQYHLNAQVDGYLYALHMDYPGEVGGVWVDAALVHKTEEGFKFIPVEKQIAALDQWLGETGDWVKTIEADIAEAKDYPTQLPYMRPFKRRTENCVSFERTCSFLQICMARPNPIGMDVPRGFTKEPWDPLEHLNRDRLQLPKPKE